MSLSYHWKSEEVNESTRKSGEVFKQSNSENGSPELPKKMLKMIIHQV